MHESVHIDTNIWADTNAYVYMTTHAKIWLETHVQHEFIRICLGMELSHYMSTIIIIVIVIIILIVTGPSAKIAFSKLLSGALLTYKHQ